mmetsp:Transcript_91/g.159  ORF Transcript_91/g.159 Transcript_91/m.159 type:complete len:217 (-) Transcript_91:429-1079(-)
MIQPCQYCAARAMNCRCPQALRYRSFGVHDGPRLNSMVQYRAYFSAEHQTNFQLDSFGGARSSVPVNILPFHTIGGARCKNLTTTTQLLVESAMSCEPIKLGPLVPAHDNTTTSTTTDDEGTFHVPLSKKLVPIQPKPSVADERRPPNSALVCPECGAHFTRISYVQVHQKAVHRREQPFECDVCFKRFSVKSNLTRHRKQFHLSSPREGMETQGC